MMDVEIKGMRSVLPGLTAVLAMLSGCTSPATDDAESGPNVTAVTMAIGETYQETNGMVVIEAEKYHTQIQRGSHAWEVIVDRFDPRQHYMTARPDIGVSIDAGYAQSSPELIYEVDFQTAGTFYLWIRGTGFTVNDDTCHVGLDGVPLAIGYQFSRFDNRLSWSNRNAANQVVAFEIDAPGLHTIHVWMSEDGFRMHKLILTTDSSYTPTDLGPDESDLHEVECRETSECDDGNICTDDTCDAHGVCVHTDNTASCDDGDSCTENDQCSEGVCAGSAVICDDLNECTEDSCVDGACAFTPISAPCDDGDACTLDDICSEGVCVPGTPMLCEDDGNVCTDEVCSDGVCGSVDNTAACDDGDACTVDDVCSEGVCVSGSPMVCEDDGNICTDEVCSDGVCGSVNNTAPCDDGDACTLNDSCAEGACVPGSPMVCEDDGNICTDEVCSDGVCGSVNNTAACDDGDACTLNDTCVAGSCVSGDPMICEDDGNICTDEVCVNGACSATFNTSPCDDGDACTINDVCGNGVCEAGNEMNCDDSDPCTDDMCMDGVCSYSDNGACGDTETETCTPNTYFFKPGVNGYTDVIDINVKQRFPNTAYPSDEVVSADLRDVNWNPNTQSQVLIRFGSMFGSGEGQIPLSAIVQSATLSFLTTDASTGPLSVHRMLMAFDETSTWNSLMGGVNPDDVEALAVPDMSVTITAVGQRRVFDVTTSMVAWSENPASNFGWAILNSSVDGWNFYSADAADEENRPEIYVNVCEFDETVDTDTGSDTDTEVDTDM